ncbi:MAG TPA: nucleotidyltransferase domain-containing protein [Hanamia sp.]|nr:nucleotidyltransferase domain-containing protein [Hanamia sp.]
MRDEIKNELANLEKDKNIKILYAVESGSRAWGFESKDSDWDVRFIYVHQYDWYLSINEKKDNIEKMLPNDLDLSGWELKKTLLLFRKSNPPLLEWLRSPIIYKEEFTTVAQLRNAVKSYFNPKSCLYHYLHMANGNYEAYFKNQEVKLKKYFYVLRPILACCWIERTNEMAPMEFDILLDKEISDPILKNKIINLLSKKKNGDELKTGNRIKVIDDFIIEKLNYFKSFLADFKFNNSINNDLLNSIFRNTLKEVWKNN